MDAKTLAALGTPPVASSAWCKVIRVHRPAAAANPQTVYQP
jgi:hypothetical protein